MSRIRAKMAEAVALARLHGAGPVDLALGHAAVMERFGVPATTRASFGLYNTREEVEALVAALHRARKLFG